MKKSFFASVGVIVVFIKGSSFCNVQWIGPPQIGADPDLVKDGLIALAKKIAKKV